MNVTVEIEGLTGFLRALGRFAPDVRKEFNRTVQAVLRPLIADARGRASWSKRIPAAIVPTVTTRGVGVRVSKRRAPHGPLYERGSKDNASVVRHPLFGNRNFWYSTPVRPFLQPAIDEHKDEAVDAMLQAIKEAKRGAGLR